MPFHLTTRLTTYLLFISILLSSCWAFAQDYRPTAVEGANWTLIDQSQVFHPTWKGVVQHIQGDTLLEGVAYKKLWQAKYNYALGRFDSPIPPFAVGRQNQLIALIRDELATRKVFGRIWLQEEDSWTSDTLIHDYSLGIGDTLRGFYFDQFSIGTVILDTLSFEIDGEMYIRQETINSAFTQGSGSSSFGPLSRGFSEGISYETNYLMDHCVGSFSDCGLELRSAYQPSAVEGARWIHVNTRALFSDPGAFMEEVEGDTLVDGQLYKKLYRRTVYFDWNTRDNTFPDPPYEADQNRTLLAVVRDDLANRKVYGRELTVNGELMNEVLYHDFDLWVGDTLKGFYFNPGLGPIVIDDVGQRELFGVNRNIQYGARRYAEGIGSSDYGILSGGLSFFTNDGTTSIIDHCVGAYEDCGVEIVDPTEEPYTPLAVENANWVIWDRGNDDELGGHRALTIRGDTIINGVGYKKLFRRDYVPLDINNIWNALPPYPISSSLEIFAFVRDDISAQKVYCRYADPDLQSQYPGEQLLHDFSVNLGEQFMADSWCDSLTIDRQEWLTRYGLRRKYQYVNDYRSTFVSGIGKLRGRNAGVFNFGEGCDEPGSDSEVLAYCIGSDEACGFTWPTSTQYFATQYGLSLAPNPLENELVISTLSPLPNTVFATLRDVNGRILRQESLRETRRMKTTALLPGVYFLTFSDGQNAQTVKLVKQ